MDENTNQEEVNMTSSTPVFETAEISLKEKICDALANPKNGHNQRLIIIVVTIFVTMIMFLSNIVSVMASNKKTIPKITVDPPQTALTKQMLFTDYSMAKAQSYGFFYDIRLEEWELMRQRMRNERKNLQNHLVSDPQQNVIYGQQSNSWYQVSFCYGIFLEYEL